MLLSVSRCLLCVALSLVASLASAGEADLILPDVSTESENQRARRGE